MLDENRLRALVGHDVVDRDGKSIGYVATIFGDRATGEPEWVGVLVGTFFHHHVLVPVDGAEVEGSSLRVPWTKDHVKRAPTYDENEQRGILGIGDYRVTISDDKEREAYAHYGLQPAQPA